MSILEYWNSMTAAQQCFMFAAVPATLVLVLQTLVMLMGLDGGDGDADLPDELPDGSFDSGGFDGGFEAKEDFSNCDDPNDLSGDFRIFTVRGFVAFFAVFGWTGAALLEGGLPLWFAAVLAFLAGAVAMVLIAWIMKSVLKLQSSGNLDPKNAVGKAGVVYITIPKRRTGIGKVNLVVQERYSELEAVTDSENDISTGREVVVVGVTTLGTLIVREK